MAEDLADAVCAVDSEAESVVAGAADEVMALRKTQFLHRVNSPRLWSSATELTCDPR